MVKVRMMLSICIVISLLSGCSEDSFPEQGTDTETSEVISFLPLQTETMTTEQTEQTGQTEQTDSKESTEGITGPVVLKSDPDSDAPFLFEVTLEKTEYACNERFKVCTAVINNGEPFETYIVEYYADCRLFCQPTDSRIQNIDIMPAIAIPDINTYGTIEAGQRGEQCCFFPDDTKVTDAQGHEWRAETAFMPAGTYSIEVFYQGHSEVFEDVIVITP